MKGLLQKDICLLLGRNKSMLVLLVVGAMMGLSADGLFVVGYMTMLACIMSISTISYDEFDNGYPFLFTLPITRKDYVNSKYVIGIIMGIFGMIIGIVFYIIGNVISKEIIDISMFMNIISYIFLIMMVLAIMIPLQLKFGAEKSRIAIAVIAAGCTMIGFLAKNVLASYITVSIENINDIPDITIKIAMGIISLILISISYIASLKIVENKEF